jgi:hypothetical protein
VYQADPYAIPYQSPAWFDCLCAVGGFTDASRYYETDDGKRLIMPLVRRSYLPGPLAIQDSLPNGWGMGGLLSSAPFTPEDARLVLRDLAQMPALRTSIRPNPLLAEAWAAAKLPGMVAIPRVSHVLDLAGGADAVWTKKFSTNTRNMLRKAQKSNIEVESDTAGRLVPVFYDLLRLSFDRWAQQQHEPRWLSRLRNENRDPLRKFQAIAANMGDACRFWVARIQGQPVAAIMVLQGTNVNYSRGAMNKALIGTSRANELLQWLAIEEACRVGARHYHMGETGTSTALAAFKGKFGADPISYEEYRVERLPITQAEKALRGAFKRAVGFKDYTNPEVEQRS